jgi:hypothetical protein
VLSVLTIDTDNDSVQRLPRYRSRIVASPKNLKRFERAVRPFEGVMDFRFSSCKDFCGNYASATDINTLERDHTRTTSTSSPYIVSTIPIHDFHRILLLQHRFELNCF